MKQQVIIKHGSTSIDIISYDDDKACGSDIVERWQKKQPEYLLRGKLRACRWTLSSKAGLVGAMIDSARL